MARKSTVITGRGVLSPIGCDWPSFAEAVRSGKQASPAPYPGALPDDPVAYLPLSEDILVREGAGRRDEPLSVLATFAARQALAEADIACDGEPRDDVGLVMNTVPGPLTAVETYLERLMERGPSSARPGLFVDTLLSMPASRVGITLRLRGSTAVVGGSSAFELAFDWVRSGRQEVVVAGAAENQAPKCLRYLREVAARSGAQRPLFAQSAGFLVMEEAGRASQRGARPLAELLGAGAASEPQDAGRSWSTDPEGRAFSVAMQSALAEADLEPDDVSTVVLASGDDASEACEMTALRDVFGDQTASLALLRPKRLLGEAVGAAAGVSLLAALAMNGHAGERVVAVNTYEWGGGVSSLLMRVPPA